MAEFQFRADGLNEANLRHRKKLRRPTGVPTGLAVLVGITALLAYSAGHPPIHIDADRLRITSSASDATTKALSIQVSGVTQDKTESITLYVNGSPRLVSVGNSAFATNAPLIPGENTIQALVGNVASNVLNITAEIPRSDIWIELTWEGSSDIDLHLYLPNGEHLFYGTPGKRTGAGAALDVDNTTRDGPEHITMEKAIAGEYRVTVLYFAATQRPPRAVAWRVNVRLRDGDVVRSFSGILSEQAEEQDVYTFLFP